MSLYVALIVDAHGRYAHVQAEASSFDQFSDVLEDLGCEVVEDQTNDWYECTTEEIKEDCMSIQQLTTESDYVPHP